MELRQNFKSFFLSFSGYCTLAVILFFLIPGITFGQKITTITIKDGINPATAEFIQQSIETAEKEKSQCLIINLNTPGGLLTSTRDIVTDMMKSEVPIVVFVSPSGAHAGSAGVFITMAADIAAAGSSDRTADQGMATEAGLRHPGRHP